jgi:transcriptional regulator with XRE-family HTH domain
MCRDIGMQPSILTDLKKGRQSGLSAKNAQKVASYFGVSVAYLLGEEKQKPATTGDGQMLVNNDPELTELLERVRDDPNLRMLFSVTKDATAEDIQQAIKIIQALK